MGYPTYAPVPAQYMYGDIMPDGCEDRYMVYVLNQRTIYSTPTGIREVPCSYGLLDDNAYINKGFPHAIISQPSPVTNFTPCLDKNDYTYFGVQYRDHIYNVIIPRQSWCKVLHCGMRNEEEPLWADCQYIIKTNIVRHAFRLQEVCEGFDLYGRILQLEDKIAFEKYPPCVLDRFKAVVI
jgi:hypothetical protein